MIAFATEFKLLSLRVTVFPKSLQLFSIT